MSSFTMPPVAPKHLGHVFYENQDLENVVKNIELFCKEMKVDFKEQNFVYKCELDKNFDETIFYIYIYTDSNGYIIEIKKWRGCSFGFIDIIKEAKRFFPLKDKSEFVLTKPFTPPPIEMDPTHIMETTKNMLSMLASPFVDVQEQAIIIFANQRQLEKDEIWKNIPLFITKINSGIPNIQRCAIAILANVYKECKTEDYYQELKTSIEKLCLTTSIPKILHECKRFFVLSADVNREVIQKLNM